MPHGYTLVILIMSHGLGHLAQLSLVSCACRQFPSGHVSLLHEVWWRGIWLNLFLQEMDDVFASVVCFVRAWRLLSRWDSRKPNPSLHVDGYTIYVWSWHVMWWWATLSLTIVTHQNNTESLCGCWPSVKIYMKKNMCVYNAASIYSSVYRLAEYMYIFEKIYIRCSSRYHACLCRVLTHRQLPGWSCQ